jgi:hypothetical protein
MLYMNDYDLTNARYRFIRASCPNRLALVMVVDRLREWADDHSDGWHSWSQPARAAKKAMEHIESRTNAENQAQENSDITTAQMLAAVTPIRSFLTRCKASPEEKELIFRAVTDGPGE